MLSDNLNEEQVLANDHVSHRTYALRPQTELRMVDCAAEHEASSLNMPPNLGFY